MYIYGPFCGGNREQSPNFSANYIYKHWLVIFHRRTTGLRLSNSQYKSNTLLYKNVVENPSSSSRKRSKNATQFTGKQLKKKNEPATL